jgi:uncharacterized membrane protein YgcG
MKRFFLLFLIFAGALRAEEEILDFHSRVEIQKNGDLLVTEAIAVQADGNEIKRGIYRDFPTLYRSEYGLNKRVPFDVQEILRDGKAEPWHGERRENGLRIYVGNKDVLLEPGRYVYTIRYRTAAQLGFFADRDELYWNVTGNGWVFPMARVTAEVELPPDATITSVEAYTGPEGSKDQNYQASKSGNRAVFQTTQVLGPHEGLTIVASWPKGLIVEPSRWQSWEEVVRANMGIVLGLAGLALAFFYFLIVWVLFGKDPERGVIIPLYEPPEGLSPAAVRYVRGLGKFDDTSLAASILYLAVLGAIKIKGGGNTSYTVEEKPNAASLPPESAALFRELLGSRRSLVFKNTNHKVFKAAKATLAKAVSKLCDTVYFVRNVHLWVAGLIFTLIPLAVSLSNAKNLGAAVFMLIWLSFWSIAVGALSMTVVSSWRQAGWARLGAVPLTLFAMPFFAGWFFGMWMLVNSTSLWVCGIYLTGILMTVIFHHLLKKPTPAGRVTQDQIEGFRRYLSVAEEDRLNLENPPERTPELFEKFLPYALALGVEQRWAEQFSDILKDAQYEPEWYGGNQVRNFQAASLAAGLGSALAGAISSSSSAPGSSSGGGGGGSSGGGGGGGGGGGW